MNAQDKKFNTKIILAAMVAVIIAILIAFYYSYAQSQSQISFLENEKEILIKDLTLVKADISRLTTENEVGDIELERSKYEIQQLIDSVGRLNFDIGKLREFKGELRKLQSRNDSLKLKNNFLKYSNMILTEKVEDGQKEIQTLQAAQAARNQLTKAESLQRKTRKELDEQLQRKKYLVIDDELTEGHAFRLKSSREAVKTNKASVIEKLNGCVTIESDSETTTQQEKIIYFQFLGPSMGVIEDNANTITVNGNIYSKRVQFLFDGKEKQICDFITIPEGSLESGTYTLNVFENEKLLSTAEFRLK